MTIKKASSSKKFLSSIWVVTTISLFLCVCVDNDHHPIFSGCGSDWAVSPLSRLLTVLYLLVGLPIMYLYLTSTGALMARMIGMTARALVCKKAAAKKSSKSSTPSETTPQHHFKEPRRSNSYNDKLQRSTWQTRSSLAAAQSMRSSGSNPIVSYNLSEV